MGLRAARHGAARTSEDAIFAKCAWRLLPLLVAANVVSLLDRVNVGLAALTMNHDLGFTPEVYGRGAGIFFWGYFLFEVPSNLLMEKVGARMWIGNEWSIGPHFQLLTSGCRREYRCAFHLLQGPRAS